MGLPDENRSEHGFGYFLEVFMRRFLVGGVQHVDDAVGASIEEATVHVPVVGRIPHGDVQLRCVSTACGHQSLDVLPRGRQFIRVFILGGVAGPG